MKSGKLTPQDVICAYQEYLTNGISLLSLGKKYGVTDSALPYHFKKLGWRGIGRKGVTKYTGDETSYICSHCKRLLPVDRFSRRTVKNTPRLVVNRCKQCTRLYRLSYKLKVTVKSIEDISTRSAGYCESCGIFKDYLTSRNKVLVLDHNHETGKLRGMLCDMCNLSLSSAVTIECLSRYANYLQYADTGYIAKKGVYMAGLPLVYAHIHRTYGLESRDYINILKSQSGLCACCNKVYTPSKKYPRLLVDHCHVTGKIRGLVCPSCNIMAGIVDADGSMDRLLKLKIYLERYDV